jgi:hypothetical protein
VVIPGTVESSTTEDTTSSTAVAVADAGSGEGGSGSVAPLDTRPAASGSSGPQPSFWILIMALNALVLTAAAYQGIVRRPGGRRPRRASHQAL